MRGLVVVYTVEKADSTHRVLVSFGPITAIHKGSDPAYFLSLFVEQDPANSLPKAEGLVLLRVKDLLHIFVQGADIIEVLGIKQGIDLQKGSPELRGIDFYDLHDSKGSEPRSAMPLLGFSTTGFFFSIFRIPPLPLRAEK